jgi:hypothetical protein
MVDVNCFVVIKCGLYLMLKYKFYLQNNTKGCLLLKSVDWFTCYCFYLIMIFLWQRNPNLLKGKYQNNISCTQDSQWQRTWHNNRISSFKFCIQQRVIYLNCPANQTLNTIDTWHTKKRENGSHQFQKFRTTASKICTVNHLCTGMVRKFVVLILRNTTKYSSITEFFDS